MKQWRDQPKNDDITMISSLDVFHNIDTCCTLLGEDTRLFDHKGALLD